MAKPSSWLDNPFLAHIKKTKTDLFSLPSVENPRGAVKSFRVTNFPCPLVHMQKLLGFRPERHAWIEFDTPLQREMYVIVNDAGQIAIGCIQYNPRPNDRAFHYKLVATSDGRFELVVSSTTTTEPEKRFQQVFDGGERLATSVCAAGIPEYSTAFSIDREGGMRGAMRTALNATLVFLSPEEREVYINDLMRVFFDLDQLVTLWCHRKRENDDDDVPRVELRDHSIRGDAPTAAPHAEDT